MKIELLNGSLLWLFLMSVGLLAQAPPPPPPTKRPGPPPPPVIYAKPDDSEIKEFSAPGEFAAAFAGEPGREVRERNGATVTIYRVRRLGSNSGVIVTLRADDLTDRIDAAFLAIREAILLEPRSTIMEEKDINLQGLRGREFEIDLGIRRRLVRVFIDGHRVIEIHSDVTNWHIISEKTKDQWRKETSRFFDSLKILK